MRDTIFICCIYWNRNVHANCYTKFKCKLCDTTFSESDNQKKLTQTTHDQEVDDNYGYIILHIMCILCIFICVHVYVCACMHVMQYSRILSLNCKLG